jgi:hypothetical protein
MLGRPEGVCGIRKVQRGRNVRADEIGLLPDDKVGLPGSGDLQCLVRRQIDEDPREHLGLHFGGESVQRVAADAPFDLGDRHRGGSARGEDRDALTVDERGRLGRGQQGDFVPTVSESAGQGKQRDDVTVSGGAREDYAHMCALQSINRRGEVRRSFFCRRACGADR